MKPKSKSQNKNKHVLCCIILVKWIVVLGFQILGSFESISPASIMLRSRNVCVWGEMNSSVYLTYKCIFPLACYNSISVLSGQEKCKNLISCWWKAVCSLREWREVRLSQCRTWINLTFLIFWCCCLTIYQLPSLMSCFFASHLHPLMSHLSLITQASRVLGFSFLLPLLHLVLLYLSLCFLSFLSFDCYCWCIIRCDLELESFNLPNKLKSPFSSAMCSCQRNMLFCLFWTCISDTALKTLP